MITLVIKVKPGSFKDEISLEDDGTLLVKIREKPIDGAANAYLLKFLSKEWDISKRVIALEKGATTRFKKIGLDMDETAVADLLNRYKK